MQNGRRTCHACLASAKLRVGRTRERRKDQRQKLRKYEVSGAAAVARFAYNDAAIQFEKALAITEGAQSKLYFHLARAKALFYGARPHMATPWFERALELCLQASHLQYVYNLRHLARQRWIEQRTTQALPLLERTRELIPTVQEDPSFLRGFFRQTDALISTYLTLVGRYVEAARHLSIADAPPKIRRDEGSIIYLAQCGVLHSIAGKEAEAFAHFEYALVRAQNFADGYHTVAILDDYATWAIALGRLDIALTCYEKALFIARERALAWRVPYITLQLAGLLLKTGNYEQARLLISNALVCDLEAPILRVLGSILLLELSEVARDVPFQQAPDNEALEIAFHSGEVQRISRLAA
ncbi:MAG TPA: hypothetical protein VFA15_02140, partial [Nitrososphaera sp.]|nr:hypothetical protein [Nitrososphaera sp.]